jgi:hypothetical protein
MSPSWQWTLFTHDDGMRSGAGVSNAGQVPPSQPSFIHTDLVSR